MSFELALAAIVPLVTHGSGDGADPAVVAIVTSTGEVACSGTVIAPHFVLTAAHCIVPEIARGASVVMGATVAAPTSSGPVAATRVDPAFDAASLAHDAALIVLRSPAPVDPVALATAPPDVGSSVRIVGWGRTAASGTDVGTKREGTSSVTAVEPLSFTLAPGQSQPCEGDSGGPALAASAAGDVLAGIASHGDSACASDAAYTRVDAVNGEFIAPTLAALGDGTAATGASCMFAEQCADMGSCVVASDDPNVSYCTRGCRVNADCPGAMICAEVGDGDWQCRYPLPTPGAPGSGCTVDADCVDSECAGIGVCAARCDPLQGCSGDALCTNVGGIDFFCIAPPLAASGGSCSASPRRRDDAALLACAVASLVLPLARRRARRR